MMPAVMTVSYVYNNTHVSMDARGQVAATRKLDLAGASSLGNWTGREEEKWGDGEKVR